MSKINLESTFKFGTRLAQWLSDCLQCYMSRVRLPKPLPKSGQYFFIGCYNICANSTLEVLGSNPGANKRCLGFSMKFSAAARS